MTLDFSNGLSLAGKIGQGCFGAVFEGADHIHGRVAVKIYEKQAGEDDSHWSTRKSNLLKEGQSLKSAEHENVVRVFRVTESTDGMAVGLVMEFCPGGCLNSICEAGPMRFRDLRAVLSDAALGLEAIHARGMLHRDIKPSNILRTQNSRTKIGDFGFVTNYMVLGYASDQGYFDHFAPEVYHTGLTSQKTDVWAFGMTAYRLLHGKTFYEEAPRPANIIPVGGFAAGLSWLPHIPTKWRRFVTLCLHDDPAKRIANTSEILRGLERLPIEPDWICDYSADQVVWQNTKSTSVVRIEWLKHSPRKHEWLAQKISSKSNKPRRIGGSNGYVGKQQARAGLKAFFQIQNAKG